MCGFVAYISKNKINTNNFEQANNAIQHRGPNADGFYYNEENTIALAHRRLSIIDLSNEANQPLHSKCNRYVIVYNGELYNYQQLKHQYQLQTKTNSDTEVILEAYIKNGVSIFKELNGMFAFAIYDKQQQQLIICRDRLGIKPLFIYQDEDNIVLASELKAIRQLKNLNYTINKKAIPYFLHLGFIPQPYTIYQNIEKFPAAHYSIIDTNNISKRIVTQSYWTIKNSLEKEKIINYNDAKKQLEDLLFNSIEQQLVADVPIGTFLSGGIDSSLVTAISSKIKKEKVNTFSIGFNYNKFDESTYAQNVANYLGTQHHAFTVTENQVVDLLSKILTTYDEPYADSSCYPSLLVAHLAKQHVTVALAGDGGDELFHGYGSSIWAQRLQKWYSHLGKNAIYFATQLSKNNRIKRAGTLFNYKNKQHIYSHIFSQEQYLFSENELQEILVNPNYNFDDINQPITNNQQLTASETQSIWDIQHYLKDDLLVKMDRASMQHALEVRVPILDNNIVDFAMQIPAHFKMKKGIQKYILKEVLYQFIPKQYFDRPKQGFAIPLIKWLKNDWQFLLEKYLNKTIIEQYNIVQYDKVESIKKRFLKNEDYLYNRIWVLIILHWWLEENNKA